MYIDGQVGDINFVLYIAGFPLERGFADLCPIVTVM